MIKLINVIMIMCATSLFVAAQLGTIEVDDQVVIGHKGEMTPNANLHIYDSTPSFVLDGSLTNIRFETNGTRKAYIGMNFADLYIQNALDAGISFQTNGTERIKISNVGNVGIGIDDPDHKLHIDGSVNLFGEHGNRFIGFSNTERIMSYLWFINNDFIIRHRDENGGDLYLRSNDEILFEANNEEKAKLDEWGYTVEGWMRSDGLSFIQDLNVNDPPNQIAFSYVDLAGLTRTLSTIDHDGIFSQGPYSIGTWGNLILSSDRVGVGTESPSRTLDIDGDLRIRDIPSLTGSSDLRYNSAGVICKSTSDLRLKENIETVVNALAKVRELNGVSFIWKEDPSVGRQLGMIAQEVKEVFPEVVNEDDQGYLSIDYTEMTGVLVEAIKSQQDIIEDLEKKYKQINTELIRINRKLISMVSTEPFDKDSE